MPNEPSPLELGSDLLFELSASFFESDKFSFDPVDEVPVFKAAFTADFCPLFLSLLTLTNDASCVLFWSFPMLTLFDVFCFFGDGWLSPS